MSVHYRAAHSLRPNARNVPADMCTYVLYVLQGRSRETLAIVRAAADLLDRRNNAIAIPSFALSPSFLPSLSSSKPIFRFVFSLRDGFSKYFPRVSVLSRLRGS